MESVPDTCGGAPVTGSHLVYFSTDGFGPRALYVSVQDGACFEFVAQTVSFDYRPLIASNVPDVWSIEAAAYLDGLYLFTR